MTDDDVVPLALNRKFIQLTETFSSQEFLPPSRTSLSTVSSKEQGRLVSVVAGMGWIWKLETHTENQKQGVHGVKELRRANLPIGADAGIKHGDTLAEITDLI